MFIKDGSDVDYDSKKSQKNRYSWGWMGKEIPEDYIGWNDPQLKKKVIKRLREITCKTYNRDKFEQHLYCVKSHMGHHRCEVCQQIRNNFFPKKEDHDLGWNGSILIKHKNKEFRSPWAVVHYIQRHDYRPADEVIDALFHGQLTTYDEVDGKQLREFYKRMEKISQRNREEFQRLKDAKSPEQKAYEKFAKEKVQQLRDSGAIIGD